MLRTALAGVGLVAIVGITAVAIKANHYADDNPPPAVAVNYTGLDLSTDGGVAALDRRIGRAINSICRFDGTRSLHQTMLEQKCRDNAWASTRPQVAVAIDIARHGGQGGVAGPAYPSPLGAAIEQARWDSFQSGQPSRWRDGSRRGVVVVSPSRRFGMVDCRNVAVYRASHGEWETLAEGPVCLGGDGRLHDGPPTA